MRRILLTTAAATAVMLGGCIYIDRGHADFEKIGDLEDCSSIQIREAPLGGEQVSLKACEIDSRLETDGDARLMGADISVSGRAGGTVRVTAADFVARDLDAGAVNASVADLVYHGAVAGDVDLNAADIRWHGPVGGDFDASAADLDFDGSVTGRLTARVGDARLAGRFSSLNLQGADVHLTREAEVGGDVQASVADLRHDGRIAGDLDLAARTVILNGDVEGQLDLNVDPGRRPWGRHDGLVELNGQSAGGEICARRVVITGEVSGPLRVRADEAPEIQGGSAADIDFTPRNGQRCDRGWED